MKRILSLIIALCLILGACGDIAEPPADIGSDIGVEAPVTEPVEAEADEDEPQISEEKEDSALPPEEPDISVSGELAIHFIDVGQADAALVLCGDSAMLIDGGNAEDSSLIYTYLQRNDIKHLDYIIATHPHEDHIGGLPGALSVASVGKILSPVVTSDNSHFEKLSKKASENGVRIELPKIGESFSLGGAKVEILGPVTTDYEDINNASIILRIVYGKTAFLFTGDAERESEQDILASGADISADVLKVGHHGSRDSSTYPFLNAIMPKYAVISVGKGNSYGHPTDEALSRLRDADAQIMRTDELGDIICISDGENITFENKKYSAPPTPPPPEPAIVQNVETPEKQEEEHATKYILNKNTKKFHKPGCSGVKNMSEKNKIEFSGTRQEVIDRWYVPCKICKP